MLAADLLGADKPAGLSTAWMKGGEETGKAKPRQNQPSAAAGGKTVAKRPQSTGGRKVFPHNPCKEWSIQELEKALKLPEHSQRAREERGRRYFLNWLKKKEGDRGKDQAERERQEKKAVVAHKAEQAAMAAHKAQARREAERQQRDAHARWAAVAEPKMRLRREAEDALREAEEADRAEREEREWRRAVEHEAREAAARQARYIEKREVRSREVQEAALRASRQTELLSMRQNAEREWHEAARAAYAAGAPLPKHPAHVGFEMPTETEERRLFDDRARAAARVRVRQEDARKLRASEEATVRQAAVLRQLEAAERLRERQKRDALRRQQKAAEAHFAHDAAERERAAVAEAQEWEVAERRAVAEAQERVARKQAAMAAAAETEARVRREVERRVAEEAEELSIRTAAAGQSGAGAGAGAGGRAEAGQSLMAHTLLTLHKESAHEEAERIERQKVVQKAQRDALAKAKQEWANAEERVRKEAEERGKLEGEATARREAAARERQARFVALASVDGGNVGGDPRQILWESAHAGNASALRRAIAAAGPSGVRSAHWLESTPLHAAAAGGHDECAELLLKAGVAVDETSPGGRSALFAACLGGQLGCVQLLLRSGAALNATDNWGSTPLIAAAAEGHPRVVQLLLERGADLDAKGQHGTALQLTKHDECRELLLQHKAILAQAARGRS